MYYIYLYIHTHIRIYIYTYTHLFEKRCNLVKAKKKHIEIVGWVFTLNRSHAHRRLGTLEVRLGPLTECHLRRGEGWMTLFRHFGWLKLDVFLGGAGRRSWQCFFFFQVGFRRFKPGSYGIRFMVHWCMFYSCEVCIQNWQGLYLTQKPVSVVRESSQTGPEFQLTGCESRPCSFCLKFF